MHSRYENAGSFKEAVSRVLFYGNFVGFPVSSSLKWKSLRVAYSGYLIVVAVLLLVCFVFLLWMDERYTGIVR
jgi:hypothetical protein